MQVCGTAGSKNSSNGLRTLPVCCRSFSCTCSLSSRSYSQEGKAANNAELISPDGETVSLAQQLLLNVWADPLMQFGAPGVSFSSGAQVRFSQQEDTEWVRTAGLFWWRKRSRHFLRNPLCRGPWSRGPGVTEFLSKPGVMWHTNPQSSVVRPWPSFYLPKISLGKLRLQEGGSFDLHSMRSGSNSHAADSASTSPSHGVCPGPESRWRIEF